MIFSTPISLFKNAMSTEPTTVTLKQFLQSRRHVAAIETLRAHNNKEIRDDLKKRLPAATISGTFTKRNIAGIVAYNGLLCMDFDHADNPDKSPEQIKDILSEFPEVAYAALSVGGKGIFAIIPTNNTDPAQHGRIVDFMRLVFLETGLLIDRACKDVCRLRFVSHDPVPFVNPTPKVFDAVNWLAQYQKGQRKPPRTVSADGKPSYTRTRVEQYIAAIEAGNVNVAHEYREWTLLGFALASEFGRDGEDYFHRVSQFSSKYDYARTEKKYNELCRNGSGRVRIGTFFKICQEAGIRL